MKIFICLQWSAVEFDFKPKSPINIFYLSHYLLAKLFLSLASPLLQITPYKPIARYCFADYFPILFGCNLMKCLLLKYKTTGLFVVKLIEKLNSFHFRDFQLRQTARLHSKKPVFLQPGQHH